MDYDYNFENADYLTTLDSIRSNLYKVTANINMEIFSINSKLKDNKDPELEDKKEKLEKCLSSIIELTDSLANNFVEVDKLMANKSDNNHYSVREEIKDINTEIINEAIKNTNNSPISFEKTEEENNSNEEVEKIESTSVEPPIEAFQEEVKEEKEDSDGEVEKIESTDTVETTDEKEEVEEKPIYIANKIDDGVSKAILVTDEQFKNLDASRDSQIALCKFRDLLVGKKVEEEKNDLESLLEKANQLYKDGNLEEAEKLYNQISEMNSNNQ